MKFWAHHPSGAPLPSGAPPFGPPPIAISIIMIIMIIVIIIKIILIFIKFLIRSMIIYNQKYNSNFL